MSTPTLEQVNAALATVNDPEIKRPITELNMVSAVEVDADGQVRVEVLLTVSGCPMKDTLTREVTNAVSVVPGVRSVMPSPITMEHAEPGGVSCTNRSPSCTRWSWSTWNPTCS